MDRPARNLDDLRALVQGLTRKGVRVEFAKESLVFTGEDSPMANLMLSVMGAFAEFERSLIRERQREGIALAKQRGAYKGRKKTLTPERAAEPVSQKRSLPVTTGSAGRPSTSTFATQSWSELLPACAVDVPWFTRP
jgi:DNA invertase Pin-like site-specific DNA recombinase